MKLRNCIINWFYPNYTYINEYVDWPPSSKVCARWLGWRSCRAERVRWQVPRHKHKFCIWVSILTHFKKSHSKIGIDKVLMHVVLYIKKYLRPPNEVDSHLKHIVSPLFVFRVFTINFPEHIFFTIWIIVKFQKLIKIKLSNTTYCI